MYIHIDLYIIIYRKLCYLIFLLHVIVNNDNFLKNKLDKIKAI